MTAFVFASPYLPLTSPGAPRMTIKHSTETVTVAGVCLTASIPDSLYGRTNRNAKTRTLVLKAVGDLYLGGQGVTSTSYGVKLAAGEVFAAELKPDDELYAAVATGTLSQPVIHLGV